MAIFLIGHHLLFICIDANVSDALVGAARSAFKLILQALALCLLVALALLVDELLAVLSHELLLVLDLLEGHLTRG